MQLVYCKTNDGNFGDDLNAWLWRELLPEGFFNGDAGELFYGIGTILSRRMPKQPQKIIFGSGTGSKRLPPIDSSYKIYFVRGPLTARTLGIDSSLAISDAAYLILNTDYGRRAVKGKYEVSVVPHHLSMNMLNWDLISAKTGMNIINPAEYHLDVITKIRESKLVLTESLHGAVLADAFRVNWIPVKFSYRFLTFKWMDWCESIGLQFLPVDLPQVFQGSLHIQKQVANFFRNRLGHAGLGPPNWEKRPYRNSSAQEIENFTLFLVKTAAQTKSFLSKDVTLNNCLIRMSRQLERLKEDFPVK